MKDDNDKMILNADMHLHTNHSDGVLSTNELLPLAKNKKLKCISIVDHDSIAAIEEAIPICKKLDIKLIPGVELSSSIDNQEIHILGYFINPTNKLLLDYLQLFREERIKRTKIIVHKLNKLNIPLKLESVIELAQNGCIGRLHIAAALVKQGFVNNYLQAFEYYIKNNGPAYEKKYTITPAQAIMLISQAGGLSFLAHPGNITSENILYKLINLGIDGLEVVHPNHSKDTTNYLKKIANEYFLLETGGSDFHGGIKNDDNTLGKYTIPYKYVYAMKSRLYS